MSCKRLLGHRNPHERVAVDHVGRAPPRPAAMLEALDANGTRTILVETANRFARDLMVQEIGFAILSARGINLIAADSPSSFLDDTPT
jgi:DNA invertase Pin-like site-specific DNA recombinase